MRVVLSRPGRLVSAVVAVLLGGCSSGSCTLIGCESAVFVDLGGSTGLPTTASTLTLCVDGSCQDISWPSSDPVTAVSQRVLPAPTAPRTVVVTFSGRASSGAELFSSKVSLPLVRSAPNGDGCGPVCWSAGVRLESGRLVSL